MWAVSNFAYTWMIITNLSGSLGPSVFDPGGATNDRFGVADAIEIVVGAWERCEATQLSTNPTYSVTPLLYVDNWTTNAYESSVTNGVTNWSAVPYTVSMTNTFGPRSSYLMVTQSVGKVLTSVLWYVNSTMHVDKTPELPMMAPTSYVSYYVTNAYVTAVTNGVTNWVAIAYTNIFTNVLPWRVAKSAPGEGGTNPVVTNFPLATINDIMCLMEYTSPTVNVSGLESWGGVGYSATSFEEALAAAQSNYAKLDEFCGYFQASYAALYGHTNYGGGWWYDYDGQATNFHNRIALYADTNGASCEVLATTNAVVSGGTVADGTYEYFGESGGYPAWKNIELGLDVVYTLGPLAPTSGYEIYGVAGIWYKTNDLTDPNGEYIPYGVSVGTGIVTLVSVPGSSVVLEHGPFGENSNEQLLYDPGPPSLDGPPYVGGNWSITENTGTNYYYMTGGSYDPAWYRIGTLTGVYDALPAATSYTLSGTILVTQSNVAWQTYEDHTYIVTNSWEDNVVFWEVRLWKSGMTNDCYMTDEIPHLPYYWEYAVLPFAYGDTNEFDQENPRMGGNQVFNNFGLDLDSNVWNIVYSVPGEPPVPFTNSSWPQWFGGTLSTPPTCDMTPTNGYYDGSTPPGECWVQGFRFTPKATVDWTFIYATNKYW